MWSALFSQTLYRDLARLYNKKPVLQLTHLLSKIPLFPNTVKIIMGVHLLCVIIQTRYQGWISERARARGFMESGGPNWRNCLHINFENVIKRNRRYAFQQFPSVYDLRFPFDFGSRVHCYCWYSTWGLSVSVLRGLLSHDAHRDYITIYCWTSEIRQIFSIR